MGRATKIGSVNVGKSIAHASLIDLRETDGVRFMVPDGSDLDGRTILVYEYPTGLDGMSHEQTRRHMKAALDWMVRWIRNDYGCDLSFRQVTSGNRIKISFGSQELHIGNGLYALGLVKTSDRSRLWLLGDHRRPVLRDIPTCGRTIAHELMHCFSWRSKPSADSDGHSRDARDVFYKDGGRQITTSLNLWRSLGGVIDGWKPKANVIGSPMIESVAYEGIIACGCGLES